MARPRCGLSKVDTPPVSQGIDHRHGGDRRLDAVRLRSGDPAAQDPRRNRHDDGLPFLRRRLRPGRRRRARGKVIHIEGDPSHPISEGTLCSKGAAGIQVVNNSRRLQKVLYRAPAARRGKKKVGIGRCERIAARVKQTRDKTFKTTTEGRTVNRTEAIACLGGSALDNEEAYSS